MQRSLTTQPAFIQDRFLDSLLGNWYCIKRKAADACCLNRLNDICSIDNHFWGAKHPEYFGIRNSIATKDGRLQEGKRFAVNVIGPVAIRNC